MTNIDKTYKPEGDEDALAFVRRVIADQPDREPLRIVAQLVEIAVAELKGDRARLRRRYPTNA